METHHLTLPAQIEFTDDGPPFVKGIVPGTLSGAEMIALWEESGCFEVWAEQYKDIGPGKKYADSTEYVNAMRERMAEESRQELRDFAASRTLDSDMNDPLPEA